MLVKQFLRKFPCILLALGIIAVVGGVVHGAEKGGEKLANHTMRQIIILIVIWWIGYIIARVIVQAISRKSSANRV